MPRDKDGLTRKQATFVNAYIETGNATQAAKAAYNTTYATHRVMGSENLANPRIKAAIDKRLKPIMDKTEILEELSDVARTKPKEYTENAKLKALGFLAKWQGLLDDKVTVKVETDKIASGLREFISLKQRAGELPDDAQLEALIEAACRANNADIEAVKAGLLKGESEENIA